MINEELKYDQLPRIYADNTVLGKLTTYDQAKTDGYDTLLFALDFVDFPYTAICTPKNDVAIELLTEFFAEQNHGGYDSCIFYFQRWSDGTSFSKINSMELFDSKTGSAVSVGNVKAHTLFIKLNEYLQDNDLYKEYLNVENIKNSGMMLKHDGDTFSFEEVKGPKRPDIECFYATLFLLGQHDYDRPYGETFEELRECAEEGSIYAMEFMASRYIDDKPEQAFYWFSKLAEKEYDTAMHTLGLMYTKGYGVERDFEKAAYWFRKADEYACDGADLALEEVENAMNNLQAAQNGDVKAMEDLADFYEGIKDWLDEAGDEKDNIEREYWANKAAEIKNSKQNSSR